MSILDDVGKAKARALRWEKAKKAETSLETQIPFNEKTLASYEKHRDEYIDLCNKLRETIEAQKEQLVKLKTFLDANIDAMKEADEIEKIALQIEKLKKQVADKRKQIADMEAKDSTDKT